MTQEIGTLRDFKYSDIDFHRIRKLIYQHAGISLSETKSDMVYGRVGRRLRSLGLQSFSQYLDYLESKESTSEWQEFTNALTTNLTSFFREEHHFPVLHDFLTAHEGPVNIWCCAASTGEEPYSIAMTACEAYGSLTPPVKIIATDIDTNVLKFAQSGIYQMEKIKNTSQLQREQFFLRGSGAQAGSAKIKNEIKDLVSFSQLNLLDRDWSLIHTFDIVFCRNVMIYFDKSTQSKILNHFIQHMKPNALIFFGHSENFLHVSPAFKLQGKTVYQLNRDQ